MGAEREIIGKDITHAPVICVYSSSSVRRQQLAVGGSDPNPVFESQNVHEINGRWG